MKAFNQGFLKLIIIISLLPLIPVFLISLTPAALLLVAVIVYFVWAPCRRGVNSVCAGIDHVVGAVFTGFFKAIGAVIFGLFKGLGLSIGWLFGKRTRSDPNTFSAYRAFVQGNLKTIQSVLMTADVALDPIATPEMAALTATNSFDFAELRQRPTALFIMVNQTQMDLYAFLLNLFYADLFKALLKNPQNPGRPVWLFLDEFGHLQIPGFEVFATTARKYKVSYALFLQSLGQLEGRYGVQNARTIIEALGTEIYLPGTSLETARNLEARLGRATKAPLMAVRPPAIDEHFTRLLQNDRK